MKDGVRGACPGIAAPIQTGDGLLARLLSVEPFSVETWLALCAASERHGNGVIEVTQRGNLQFRGLSEASVEGFARDIAALGLAAEEHPAILAPPLSGLECGEHPQLRALVDRLRAALPAAVARMPVGPKVSLIVDSGGALHMDQLRADLRLQLRDDARAHLAMGGDAASAIPLGWIEPRHAVEVIIAVFAMISRAGIGARARELSNQADVQTLRSMLPGLLLDAPPPPSRPPAEPIGMHPLNNAQLALGIAPAFGHSTAGMLKRFAETAAARGAHSIRPAPGRALLAMGLNVTGAQRLAAESAALGFIVQPSDPRRFVFACAGAPACGSAMLDTRRIAPEIARAGGHRLDNATVVHISGCAKGCAHPGPAALTLVGPDHIVFNGRSGDVPQARASTTEVVAGLQELKTGQAVGDLLRQFKNRSGDRA